METVNKYLLFSIYTENYAIPIISVREIIRYEEMTPIRDSQKYLKGVINLRGKIIPIIDMRLKLGIEEKKFDDRTVIIIVEINGERNLYEVGIAVDVVYEVLELKESDIEETPKVGLKMKGKYLQGIAKINEKMAMIFDIDKVLSEEEIMDMHSSVQ
jgi:purine-binding chemotaxis protein CheW